MSIGRVMDYIEARLEAIKSREEEEDEDEEKDRERDRDRSKQSATPAPQGPKPVSTPTVDKTRSNLSSRPKEQVSSFPSYPRFSPLRVPDYPFLIAHLRTTHSPDTWSPSYVSQPPPSEHSDLLSSLLPPPVLVGSPSPLRPSATQDTFLRLVQRSCPCSIHIFCSLRPRFFSVIHYHHLPLHTTLTISVLPLGSFRCRYLSHPIITATTTRVIAQYGRHETPTEYYALGFFHPSGITTIHKYKYKTSH